MSLSDMISNPFSVIFLTTLLAFFGYTGYLYCYILYLIFPPSTGIRCWFCASQPSCSQILSLVESPRHWISSVHGSRAFHLHASVIRPMDYFVTTTPNGPVNGAVGVQRFQEKLAAWNKRRSHLWKQITSSHNEIYLTITVEPPIKHEGMVCSYIEKKVISTPENMGTEEVVHFDLCRIHLEYETVLF
jgi:hypothetical protein